MPAADARFCLAQVATALEVKPGKVDFAEVKDLRLEVTLDFHRQPLIVQSEPFRIRFSELTDDKNK